MVLMIPESEAKGSTWFNYELLDCGCGGLHRVPFEEPMGRPVFDFSDGFCRDLMNWVADQREILGFA